jgi:hypothetical protein
MKYHPNEMEFLQIHLFNQGGDPYQISPLIRTIFGNLFQLPALPAVLMIIIGLVEYPLQFFPSFFLLSSTQLLSVIQFLFNAFLTTLVLTTTCVFLEASREVRRLNQLVIGIPFLLSVAFADNTISIFALVVLMLGCTGLCVFPRYSLVTCILLGAFLSMKPSLVLLFAPFLVAIFALPHPNITALKGIFHRGLLMCCIATILTLTMLSRIYFLKNMSYVLSLGDKSNYLYPSREMQELYSTLFTTAQQWFALMAILLIFIALSHFAIACFIR